MANSKFDPNLFDNFAFDFSKKYGEGGYGATFSASNRATGERLAVKIIDTRRMRIEAITKENQILEVLTHPNIISIKAHGQGQGRQAHLYFIVMELAGGGELFDQVIDRGANAMPEDVARGFFGQMIDGVAYCHLAGVAHRDLKLENVLLNAEGVIKLIDFGLSHVYPRLPDGTVDRSRPLRDVCGSKSYAAPEVLIGQGYDGFAADMWSLGVCLFAMLSGFFPLDEASANDWRYPKMVQAQQRSLSTTDTVYTWYRRSATHLSPEVKHLLDGLLSVDPATRMTMAQLREHPWIQGSRFGGASGADQGTFDQSAEVGDDAPTYRGLGGYPRSFDEPSMMDEDEEPVYRSLGMSTEEEMGGAMPVISRQRAKSNIYGADVGLMSFDPSTL